MRTFSEMSIDTSLKYDTTSTYDHGKLSLASHLVGARNRGIDITDYKNVRNIHNAGQDHIDFVDYCDVLCNLDEYEKEVKRIREQYWRRKNSVKCDKGGINKFLTLGIVVDIINKSENIYQAFWDELFWKQFRLYIDYTLSSYNSPFDSSFIHEIELTEEQKHYYFRTPSQLIEILFNPIMSNSEKQFAINAQYTVCLKLKNGDSMLREFIDKKNVINIPLEEQRIILSEFMKRNRSHRKEVNAYIRDIMKLK